MEPRKFAADEIIPMEYWGRDHWSTLAYVDGIMTDLAGFQVGNDAHMRSNRRNFRVMYQQCPKPKRMGQRMAMAVVMSPEHTSRLTDAVSTNHDDWCCIQDMIEAGLFKENALEPKMILHFSEKGQDTVSQLRKHKQGGGNYSNFQVMEAVMA